MPRNATRKETAATRVPENNLPEVASRPVVERPASLKEPDHDYALPRISIKDALKSAVKSDASDDEAMVAHPLNNPVPADRESVKPLSEEFLMMCWNAYAGQIREGRPRMSVTLKNVRPVLRDKDIIAIALNNRSQLEDFDRTTRSELEQFLRRELQHNGITIEAELIESGEDPKAKLYTSEEKFRYLSQKNPLLSTFRQKLNLELE